MKGRALCARCPVTQECEEYGAQTNSIGIWGGTHRKTKKK